MMKKDIEWLKKKIGGLSCVGTTFNRYGHGPSYIASAVSVMAVYDLIDKLDEPEVLSQEWIDSNSVYASFDGVTEEYVHVDDLKELLMPKQELPVIPKFVVDWIEENVEYGYDLYPVLKRMENNARSWERIYVWYRNNTLEFVLAYLTQEYEVKEEQKYFVSSRESVGFWFLSKNNDNEVVIGTNKDYYDREWESLKLTEQEIKDYDSRYWAFAVKVEEMEK